VLKNRKSRLTTAASVFAVSVAFAAPAQAQNEAGSSLVNVQLSDTTVLVPVSVAANLCDVNANVLAGQVRNGDTECVATPTATATAPADSAGGNSAGDSLVNVQADDTTIAVPIAVAANICDVNINALLATQLRTGTPTCTATSDSSTS